MEGLDNSGVAPCGWGSSVGFAMSTIVAPSSIFCALNFTSLGRSLPSAKDSAELILMQKGAENKTWRERRHTKNHFLRSNIVSVLCPHQLFQLKDSDFTITKIYFMNKLLGNLLNCDLHLHSRQPQLVC